MLKKKRKPLAWTNLTASQATQDPDVPYADLAMIPLCSSTELKDYRIQQKKPPPLALRYHEWLLIGEKMGWIAKYHANLLGVDLCQEPSPTSDCQTKTPSLPF